MYSLYYMNRKQFIFTLFGGAMAATLGGLKHFTDSIPVQGKKMPVLFIGHGSPMNAIEDNEFNQRWRQMAKNIPHPTAVLIVSAHWLTRGTRVTAMSLPKTIHDFGGFPQALFDVQYPAPGKPDLAKETASLITSTEVTLDHDWGLDHGAWSVAKQMFPEADIPILQLSIDYHKPPQFHYNLAKELAALRKKGILIIGSGNMVHNLGMMRIPGGSMMNINTEYGFDWAHEINDLLKKKIASKEHKNVIDYLNLHPQMKLAVPTPDHYYPLLYSLGLQDDKDEAMIFNDKAIAGSLTMTSVQLG